MGVPQGSVLGPILFSLFINDIMNNLIYCEAHLYADDLQIYSCGDLKDPHRCIYELNEDLKNISSWSISNNLLLNENKTQAIIIYKKRIDTENFPHIILNNLMIPYSNNVKNLGLILNQTLNWDDHINKVTSRIQFCIRSLWRLTSNMNYKVRKKLTISYIVPILLYGDVVMYDMNQSCKYKMKLNWNSCIRFIFSLRKYDHVSQFSEYILGCDANVYTDWRVCQLIFNLLRHKCPAYLYGKLLLAHNFRRTHNLVPVRNSSHNLNSSIFVKGIMLWNSVPRDILESLTLNQFRMKFIEWRKNQ